MHGFAAMIDDPPVMRLDPGPGEPVRHLLDPERPTRRPHIERSAGENGPGSARRRGARNLAVLAGLAGGLMAAVAAARRLGRDTPPLYRSLRATPREWSWGGHRLTYYEAAPAVDAGKVGSGAAAREPVVLVHSIDAAASAWEMRELFARFGAERRVLAYDLLGFGASDRPDADYDADLYQELLRGFLREVAGAPAEEETIGQRYAAAHQPGARYAPAAFLGDALARNTYMALRALEVPALALWSPAEYLETADEQQAFIAVAPGIEQTVIEGCGALPHEERPEEVAGAIRGFWQGLRGS